MKLQKPGEDPMDQKRLMLAVAICAGILVLWTFIMPSPPPAAVAPATDAPASVASGGAPPSAAPASAADGTPQAPQVAIERRVVGRLTVAGRHSVEFINEDGQIAAWDLEEAQYRDPGATPSETRPHRMMRDFDAKEEGKGFFLPPRVAVELGGKVTRGDYTVVQQGERTLALGFTDPSGVKITRTWEVAANDYTATLTVALENPTNAPVPYGMSALMAGLQNDADASGHLFSPPVYAFSAICQHGDDLEHDPVAKVLKHQADPEEEKSWTGSVAWGGVDNRYFMSAVLPRVGEAESCAYAAGPGVVGFPAVPGGFSLLSSTVRLSGGELAPGARVERALTFYVGPKKLDALKAQTPAIDGTVNLGWFPVVGMPMLWLMQMFEGFFGNWGIAIILLTIVVKLLTLPLTHKQYKSMAAMKKLQPALKALQKKYGEDKARQQQEMMKLYKEHKVNPLAGCLPMVLMMPIYVSLYQTIYSAVELYRADFFFWIKDLSERDPYFIWPLLLGALFFVQMRLNPSMPDNPQQKLITRIMPVMFTGMMLFLPSGLVLYIFVNTLLGLVQQIFLYKKEEEQAAPPPAGAARRRAT